GVSTYRDSKIKDSFTEQANTEDTNHLRFSTLTTEIAQDEQYQKYQQSKSFQQCLSHQYQQYQEYNRQLSESKSKKTRKRKSMLNTLLELQGVTDGYHQYLQNHGMANDNKSKNKHAGNADII
ncbi:17471_t:CDS:2, partial [Dentiscutata heterogama]